MNLMSKKKIRNDIIKTTYRIIATTLVMCLIFSVMVFAAGDAASTGSTSGTEALNKAKSLLSQVASVGGGLWAVWGIVQLGMNIKDHNGQGIGGAIWQILGGGIICAAGAFINTMNMNFS